MRPATTLLGVLDARQGSVLPSASAGTAMANPGGTIPMLRSGEPGECCEPPVKSPNPAGGGAPSSEVCKSRNDYPIQARASVARGPPLAGSVYLRARSACGLALDAMVALLAGCVDGKAARG